MVFIKGHKTNVGRVRPNQSKIIKEYYRIGRMKPNRIYSEDNKSWKGDLASKSAIHKWNYIHLGHPSKCNICGFTSSNNKSLNWANVSGNYKRIRSDWVSLCVSCHRYFDIRSEEKLMKILQEYEIKVSRITSVLYFMEKLHEQ